MGELMRTLLQEFAPMLNFESFVLTERCARSTL